MLGSPSRQYKILSFRSDKKKNIFLKRENPPTANNSTWTDRPHKYVRFARTARGCDKEEFSGGSQVVSLHGLGRFCVFGLISATAEGRKR